MHRRRPLVLTATLICALALTVSGCTPQWFLSGGGSSTSSDSSTDGNSDDASSAAGDADDDDKRRCPVGEWTLVNESWAAQLQSLFAADAGSTTVVVTGAVHLVWDVDETYTLTSTNSQYDMSGTSGGIPFFMRILHNGTETGQMSVGAGGERTQVSSGGSVDSVTSLGQSEATLEVVDAGPQTPEFFSGTMTIECSGSGLSTTVIDEGVSATVNWVPSAP